MSGGNETVQATFALVDRTLTVDGLGTGNGSVAGTSPSTISCTSTAGTDTGTCSETVSEGTVRTLTATATLGSTFTGWSGCDSVAGNVCTQTVSGGNETVQATFTKDNAALTAVKSSPDTTYSAVGDVLDYTIVVTNTGNVELTGLVIDDPLTTDEACPTTTLAPNDAMTCTATYTVTQADITNGSVSNTATVDSGQTTPQATNTVTIKFDPSQIRDRTSRVIANFMSRRADQITASDPELVSRLTGCGSMGAPFTVSGDGRTETERFSFATSLRQMLAANKKPDREPNARSSESGSQDRQTCAGFDIWASGQWSRNRVDQTSNELGLFYLGVDYHLSPSLVVGLLAQFDHSEETDGLEGFSVRGNGWLVGPYIAARLTDTLIFDGRLAWGQSNNKVDPSGFYEDDFETDRWLARARLTGDYRFGNVMLQPHIGMIYFHETQKAYTDSLNIAIPSQTISLGRLTFGPKIGYMIHGSDGSVITPHVGIMGIWDFDKAEVVDLATGLPAGSNADIRGRIEGGITVSLPNGMSLQGEGFYDGIGARDTEAYGGRLKFNLPLN